MVKGQTTKRSPDLNAAHLIERLRTQALAHLGEVPSDEIWLIADGSDLRKPYAKEMPHLSKVRALSGGLVNGYQTLSVLALTKQRRAILYHRLFSSTAPDFVSEPREVQQALETTSQAIVSLKAEMPATWILDSGFDDVAVWRTIWEQQEHVVVRLYHLDRLIAFEDGQGGWQKGSIAQAIGRLPLLAHAQTSLEVRKSGQRRAKRQTVTAEIRAGAIQLSYDTNVRRAGEEEKVTKMVWLVEVRLLDTNLDPWVLLSDWQVETEAQAVRIFEMYRQRWSVEDSFKFSKECLGWEEVQVLDLEGIRTLVALAWVAAGFLYQLGVSLEWEAVQLLAKLGGWEVRVDRRPGKITLTRGLRRLMELVTTDAILKAYYREHGPFPPQIAAFLHGWRPDMEL
jgi:hypothetical protein